MSRIFLVDLEAVETRYTGEWKDHSPVVLTNQGHHVTIISGPNDIPSATTPGAFLNFGGTNIYKANQVEQIGRLFCNGDIQSGDHFIFTDAWHPGVINLKYMSELLGIPVTIHGLWHAGSYDPQDFLGRLCGHQPWVDSAERSFFYAFDYNYFATDFHIDMFAENLLRLQPATVRACYMTEENQKLVRTGWPMEYMATVLHPYKGTEKRDLILFPHRIAPEKQVEIFKDLQSRLPQYDFVICQEQQLTKSEYHKLLSEAKIVFSANLQETLGISCYEGALLNAIPMVPDRLSYVEMYKLHFRYPSEWTESFESYQTHSVKLCNTIINYIETYDELVPSIEHQAHFLTQQFFSANKLYDNIK